MVRKGCRCAFLVHPLRPCALVARKCNLLIPQCQTMTRNFSSRVHVRLFGVGELADVLEGLAHVGSPEEAGEQPLKGI